MLIRFSVTNPDDFLVRMLKGCIQLSARPHIENTVNMVPVNHVARIVVASALFPLEAGFGVVHVNGNPRLRFNEYLETLEEYGYRVPEIAYNSWRSQLEKYVGDGEGKGESVHALSVFKSRSDLQNHPTNM